MHEPGLLPSRLLSGRGMDSKTNYIYIRYSYDYFTVSIVSLSLVSYGARSFVSSPGPTL